MPVFSGRDRNSSENASSPPAEAPIPTIGKEAGDAGASFAVLLMLLAPTRLRETRFIEVLLKRAPLKGTAHNFAIAMSRQRGAAVAKRQFVRILGGQTRLG